MSDPGEDIDLIHPPASRPDWGTLVKAIVAALGVTLLLQWPSIAAFFGIAPQP
jgi:hypothetical protein